MKRLAIIAAFVPGTVLAHGAHAPVPDAVHGAAHAGPVAVAIVITFALGAAWLASRSRN
ncbi:MAG: hypothetical protein AAGA71_04575 [Pseudomonadota bacterium]